MNTTQVMGAAPVGSQAGESTLPPLSVDAELLRMIAMQAANVRWQLVVMTSLMAALMARYAPIGLALTWLLVMNIATVVHTRTVTGLGDRRDLGERRRLLIAAISFTAHGAVLAGLLLCFPLVPFAMKAVLSLYCMGLITTTVAGVMGHPWIYYPYVAVLMAPLALCWALASGADYPPFERTIFVSLITILAATMIGHARGVYALFGNTCAMRMERYELNQKLRGALATAETANAAKTRFLASASHDLRQPIHALALFSGSLSLKKLEPQVQHIADQIEKTTTVLACQMDALLDISRLDAGVIQTRLHAVDVHAVLDQVITEFQAQADKKRLHLEVLPFAQARVYCDSTLLLRILQNLVGNALKYTEAGRVTLQVSALHGHYRLAVGDTGIGIARSDLDHVFEEFYQVANAERDRSKGLGLGLSIVRRLTTLLDIGLEVESQPGHGSTFALVIAAAADDLLPETAPPKPVRHISGECVRLLVVDDEASILDGMRMLLESLGFEVDTAEGTASAMQVAMVRRPALVISDMRLSGDDSGMRTVQALRGVWPALPALFISGDTAPDRLQQAQSQNLELLHKPVNPFALREAILRNLQP